MTNFIRLNIQHIDDEEEDKGLSMNGKTEGS